MGCTRLKSLGDNSIAHSENSLKISIAVSTTSQLVTFISLHIISQSVVVDVKKHRRTGGIFSDVITTCHLINSILTNDHAPIGLSYYRSYATSFAYIKYSFIGKVTAEKVKKKNLKAVFSKLCFLCRPFLEAGQRIPSPNISGRKKNISGLNTLLYAGWLWLKTFHFIDKRCFAGEHSKN